jgi:ubiquinone/menaquinone biosynthesis C-methylase UbiE
MDSSSNIAAIYTAAADTLDTLPFWHHFGRRTIERLGLVAGSHVVDLCCGTGASALPAAETVGPAGRVVGIDITEALLAQARAKARAAGLDSITFQCADVADLDLPRASFDAVVSVFGLFFIDDMSRVLARAWEWLAPDGVLAITTWGEDVLAPGEALFQEAVEREAPSLHAPGHAARLDTPEKIAAVFDEAGLPAPAIERDRWEMPLPSPESFWPVIMGTSNRGAYETLLPPARERVRGAVIEALRARRVTATAMDCLYATVRKGRLSIGD